MVLECHGLDIRALTVRVADDHWCKLRFMFGKVLYGS